MSVPIETHSAIRFVVVIIKHRELKVNSFYPLSRLTSVQSGIEFDFFNQLLNQKFLIGVIQNVKQNIKGFLSLYVLCICSPLFVV